MLAIPIQFRLFRNILILIGIITQISCGESELKSDSIKKVTSENISTDLSNPSTDLESSDTIEDPDLEETLMVDSDSEDIPMEVPDSEDKLIEDLGSKDTSIQESDLKDFTETDDAGLPLLRQGEGDCDNSLECAENLVCVNQNGEKEEKDSNGHGFTFVIENDIDQPGHDTCELPNENQFDINEDDIKYAPNTLVVMSNNKWYFVYCSEQDVEISRDMNKKQTWVKYGARNLGILDGPMLYCPEKGGGLSPSTCKCSNEIENYHEKRKSDPSKFEDDTPAPGSITPNEEIYIGPNNNMNACLKVVKKKSNGSLQIHSPCALEPWKTYQKCKQEGDYNVLLNDYIGPDGLSENVHNLDCSEFRLNQVE
ncbi:MAG: hypothetical protein AB8G05_12510 [Oligoflexales bacterium]